MVMTIRTDEFRAEPRPLPLPAIRAAWHAWLRRRADRNALALAGLRGPRLVADMGLDPEAVRAATGGSWDDLSPNGFLVHRRW